VGILVGEVSKYTQGLLLAFGAGALLFALTIEIYGHALHEMHNNYDYGIISISISVAAAFVGAYAYLSANRWLNAEHHKGDEEQGADIDDTSEEAAPQSTDRYSTRSLGQSTDRSRSLWKRAQTVGSLGGAITALKKRNAEKRALMKARAKLNVTQMKGREMGVASAMGAITSYCTSRKTDAAVAAPAPAAAAATEGEGAAAAISLLVGVCLEDLPESVLIGFLAAEGQLTIVFIIALFVSAFPESFSAAAMMAQAEVPSVVIVGAWCIPMMMTAGGAGLACSLMPTSGEGSSGTLGQVMIIALVEGLAAGAMMAMITTVMLVEAFEACGDHSGILALTGFLVAVAISAGGAYLTHKMGGQHDEKGHEFLQLMLENSVAHFWPQALSW